MNKTKIDIISGFLGAGKTTLVKIICGLYRPTSGEVYINDFPQESFSYAKWQSLVSVMFQESVLLPWTIDENIIGRQSTQEVSGNNKLVKVFNKSTTPYSSLLSTAVYTGNKKNVINCVHIFPIETIAVFFSNSFPLLTVKFNPLYLRFK